MVCCLLVCLACGPALAQWTTYQGDPSHDGYVPLSLDPATFSVLWQRSLSTSNLNPVTTANGGVFVSGYFPSDGKLQMLDAATGETKWSRGYSGVSVNPPAYANGLVYIQTGRGTSDTPYLWAYNANTSAQVYSVTFGAQSESYYAPTIVDNTVYVNGGAYGGMYAFDGSNGLQEWFLGLNQYDLWTPAVDTHYAYAYTGDYYPCLQAISRATGNAAFDISDPDFEWTGWSMDEALALGTHDDAFAVNGNRLICFDLKGKKIKWQLARGYGMSGQATVANGVVYAIDAGALDAIDELSGALLWNWVAPSGDLTGTTVATKTHVLASTADATYAIDLHTHSAAWSYPLGGALALSNRALYIANRETGTLAAIAVPPSSIYSVAPSRLSIAVSKLPTAPSATITLSGTASELNSAGAVLGTGCLASVTWESDRGGSGVGFYDGYWNAPTSWSTPGIALCNGTNVITVTITDLWGNKATASRSIAFEAPTGASVAILGPTTKPAWSTNAIPVLSGTASAIYSSGPSTGGAGLAQVSWSTDHGDSGLCDGTGKWTASNLILAEGANTVNVTATDIMGHTATATINVGYIPSSPGTNWSGQAMVSLPIVPFDTDPKQAVGFASDGWFAYISRYVGYGDDPTHLTWFEDPATSTPGRGFWAFFGPDRDSHLCGEVPDQSQPKTIHLNPGWNLIGCPFLRSVPWDSSAIMVKDRYQVTRTLAQSSPIVKDYLWGWDCYTRRYYLVYDDLTVPGTWGYMDPWLGYWIKATAECDLIIPAP